ncbi:MAG: dTMP kinase [Candidatus Marinimicrobia bacterium]|nr:dTMP kinase [Candidatus Neomarinimicrobiota bacterium]
MTGRLITFEGIDGSGKSTQIARLRRSLESRGYQVLVVREPGGTPISEQIRELLLHPDSADLHPRTEALLFSAARSQLVHEVIRPALAAGSIVICDRYADSSIAYQGYGRELPLEEIITTQKFATSDLLPDLKVLLDVPVDISSDRKSQEPADRMESAGRAFMARVREGYLQLARSQPEQWLIVTGQTSEEQIAQEIENYVVKIISA